MKMINIEEWDRRTHFETFINLEKPQFSICTKLNINKMLNEVNFFNRFLYVLMMTCNQVKEFKFRLHGDQVVEHEKLDISFNVLAKNNCFESKRIGFTDTFEHFNQEVQSIKDNVSEKGTLHIDKKQESALIVTSYIPWVHFDNITEPLFSRNDSLIKIVYGKYKKVGEEYLLPICITAHHALVDGFHIGYFFELLQNNTNQNNITFKL